MNFSPDIHGKDTAPNAGQRLYQLRNCSILFITALICFFFFTVEHDRPLIISKIHEKLGFKADLKYVDLASGLEELTVECIQPSGLFDNAGICVGDVLLSREDGRDIYSSIVSYTEDSNLCFNIRRSGIVIEHNLLLPKLNIELGVVLRYKLFILIFL